GGTHRRGAVRRRPRPGRGVDETGRQTPRQGRLRRTALLRRPDRGRGRPRPRHLPGHRRPPLDLRPRLALPRGGRRRRGVRRRTPFLNLSRCHEVGAARMTHCLGEASGSRPAWETAMSEESIFLGALEKETPEQRAAFLEAACGGDDALRHGVELLLWAHEKAGDFLQRTPTRSGRTPARSPAEEPGSRIGPYQLVQKIGEGGMGAVWMAEQTEPVCRRVALKVIKPGMDSRQVIARFEAERQAPALMDHPHIAKVLDAGATSPGRPYFAMELVQGAPITTFCDDHRLTPRERLGLFVHVCQAVQHAHTKGVIHRDLKPRNVLVASHDGPPVAKVIDFGVAKAIGRRLTEKTVDTQLNQLVGTPLYMSREQAGLSSLDLDTRTDVYALGVLLYELLTGTTPFDSERLRQAGYDEIRRIIREEEPARPSTRISMLGETLPAMSAQRQTDPRLLIQLGRGEADWSVVKALEKSRNQRYESASSFAADVQRYLHDEPVQACPPSLGYRLRKFVKRHRGPVLAAAVVLLALVAGVVGTTLGLVEAWRQRDRAEQARKD